MWWMIAAGVVALPIILYVIGKRDLTREEAAAIKDQGEEREAVSTPGPTTEELLVSQPSDEWTEEQEVVFYANNFHGYFINDGLDTLLTVIMMRDLSLNTMCEALTAVGAQPIVPLLKQASLESGRRTSTKAYLERMRELEAEIDKLELDVGQLSLAYALRHGVEWV